MFYLIRDVIRTWSSKMLFKKKNKDEIKKEELTSDSDLSSDDSSEDEVSPAKRHIAPSSIVKLSCFVVILASLALFIFNCISFFQNKSNNNKDDAYLTLKNKSIDETDKLLRNFGTEKQKMLKDYQIVGSKIFISENKITPIDLENKHFFSSVDQACDFNLYEIIKNNATVATTSFLSKRCYIDLNSIVDGDYFIYPSSDLQSSSTDLKNFNFYSINSSDPIKDVFYSLPDTSGNRRRIEIKNNSHSPYTMISITGSGSVLPGDRYDLVLYPQLYSDSGIYTKPTEEKLKEIDDIAKALTSKYKLKVKTLSKVTDSKNDALQQVIDCKANMSIAVFDDSSKFFDVNNDIISTLFTADYYKSVNEKVGSCKIDDASNSLYGYDYLPEIRENLGELSRAGESNFNVIGNDTKKVNSHVLKEPMVAKKSSVEDAISLVMK